MTHEERELFINIKRAIGQNSDELKEIKNILKKDIIHEIVSPESAIDLLREGWHYVDSFNNGKDTFIVVEFDKLKLEV